MPNAVLDSTVLVSAFLTKGGVSALLIRQARDGAFLVVLSDAILAETERVLSYPRLRRRYPFTDEDVTEFCETMRAAAQVVTDLPEVSVVTRDPNDDMVIATALAAHASHLITRDDDLLSLTAHKDIAILPPEAFMALLRETTPAADTTATSRR
jgi:putative PIN family toxin of toxin-antitoxin system